MASAAGNNGREAYQTTVFVSTSLDTRILTMLSGSDTVSDFKKKIMLEHHQCFPAIGNIKIHSLKVKRRGVFYHLPDSMFVKSAFGTTKGDWFVSVDASSLEQDIDIQSIDEHKAGGPLALPWVTHNCSINRHDNHGSLSVQTKTIPFVNQIVSNTNGDSCKDVSKNLEEDRLSDDKQLAISKEIHSKKRTHGVSNENLLKDPSGCGLPVKKRRKTQRVRNDVKASEENIVLTYDNDQVKDGGVSMNGENFFEHKSKDKDLISENTRINNGEGVGRENIADVAMVAEKNIQHGMSEKEKENEPVQKAVMGNDIPSSSTRASDCERDAAGSTVVGSLKGGSKHSTKHKAAEKEVFSTSFIKKFHNINKDAIDSSQQDVGSNCQDSQGDLIHKHKEDSEFSLKQGPEVKLPERRKKVKKSASKRKNETVAMHADDNHVGHISSTILAPVLDEKIIGEKNEILETTIIDESKKNDEMIVKEMKVPEPTKSYRNRVCVENVEEGSKNKLKDVIGSKKMKKNVEKTASKNDDSVVKQSNGVTTSMDALHVDCVRNHDILMNNDVVLLGTEKNSGEVNVENIDDKSERQNEKMDGVKKSTRKRKTKKSASINEDESITKHVNGNICDDVKEGDASLHDGDREDAQLFFEGLVGKAKKNNNSSPTCPQGQLSKHQSTEVELEVEPKKSQSIDHRLLEDTSKNANVSEVCKVNSEVNIVNDGSHAINSVDHFTPDQAGKIASADNREDTKKPKKKTKDEGLVGKAKKKKNKSSLTGPQDWLNKPQSTEAELESKKSQGIDFPHHLEDTSKNANVSEVCKVNSEVNIVNDGSHEINFVDHFTPDQADKIASVDNREDTKKPKKKTKDEGLVGKAKKKKNKSSLTGPQDRLNKPQSTEAELESKKSQSIDFPHHLEDTSKNVTGSEVSKVNNEVCITNDGSSEINFMDYFAPGHQLNKIASIDNDKDTQKPKKKTKDVSRNNGAIQSKKMISKDGNNEVVTDPNIPNIDQIKTPRTRKNVDAESSSSSKSFGRSFHHQKSNNQQSVVDPVKKILPVMNSLLNTPGIIFGDDDGDRSSADDNAAVNSDSSTHTPSRKSASSSSGESDSSIDSRRNNNRSHAMKRKEGGGKNSVASQSKLKNVSMTDLLRSSRRFKKAKFTASQHMEDIENQPVDFVPDSQPFG